MAQVISSSIHLNEDQIQTTLHNLWKCRKCKYEKVLVDGKPNFDIKTMKMYGYKRYTNFAERYVIYLCKSLVDEKPEIYITVESNHYDKQNILAIEGFTHIIKDYFVEDFDYPRVNICLCFVLTEAIKTHLPFTIFQQNVFMRIFSLCSLYPLIGSKTNLFGLCYKYDLVKFFDYNNKETYNHKDYSVMFSGDPISIIFNALPGDLIVCYRILNDGATVEDVQLRKVTDIKKTHAKINEAGIAPNMMNYVVTTRNLQ